MGSLSKIGQLLIALLFCASAHALTRTQAVSANASSVALTSTTVGDAILVIVGDTATTQPSLQAGYTNLTGTAANSSAARVAYKISTGGETSTGVFTNGTNIAALVYRNANPDRPFTVNGTTLASANATTTMPFNSFTMSTPHSGWIAGLGFAESATAGLNASTATLTNRTNQTTICALDSGAPLASWATESLTFTTSSNRLSVTVEVLTPSETNGFFWLIGSLMRPPFSFLSLFQKL